MCSAEADAAERAAREEAAAPLLQMGYDLKRAMHALEVTGFQGVETAVLYLLENPGLQLDEDAVEEAAAPAAAAAAAADANNDVADETGDADTTGGEKNGNDTSAQSSKNAKTSGKDANAATNEDTTCVYNDCDVLRFVLPDQYGFFDHESAKESESTSRVASQWEV